MYDQFAADLLTALPILIVAAVGIAVVLVDSFQNDSPTIPWLSGAAMLVALGMEAMRLDVELVAFAGHLYGGGAASIANLIILAGAIGSLVLSVPYLKRIGHNYGEVHALILFAVAGMMTLASSGSLNRRIKCKKVRLFRNLGN